MAQSAASCVELHICSEIKYLKSKQEKSSKKKPKAAQKADEPSFWSVLENWKSRRKYASFCDSMIQKLKKKKKEKKKLTWNVREKVTVELNRKTVSRVLCHLYEWTFPWECYRRSLCKHVKAPLYSKKLVLHNICLDCGHML